MISLERLQEFMDSAAKLADAVEKHLAEIPSQTEMTIALHELRLAQANFDNDLMKVLEELEKQDLYYNENNGKIKQTH